MRPKLSRQAGESWILFPQAAHRAQKCLRRKWIWWACWEQLHCDQCPELARGGARRIGRSALRALLHPNAADVLPSERRGAPVSFRSPCQLQASVKLVAATKKRPHLPAE